MTPDFERDVLRYDRRRIGRLHAYVEDRFCTVAAKYLLRNSGPIMIGTGFYIASAGKPETDGPPGALALARGLEYLGREVSFVTDELCAPMMERLSEGRPVHVLPIGDGELPSRAAAQIVEDVRPGVLIAIERCGPDAEGRFLQFNGTDITAFTGRMEYMFGHGIPSIGIVDGGNEIGIGAVAEIVKQLPGLPDRPCVVFTDHIVLGGIANWGAYGVLAALSKLTGKVVLVSADEEAELRAATVSAGAIDGDSGEPIGAVDGYPSELNRLVIERLHRTIQD